MIEYKYDYIPAAKNGDPDWFSIPNNRLSIDSEWTLDTPREFLCRPDVYSIYNTITRSYKTKKMVYPRGREEFRDDLCD